MDKTSRHAIIKVFIIYLTFCIKNINNRVAIININWIIGKIRETRISRLVANFTLTDTWNMRYIRLKNRKNIVTFGNVLN